MAQPKVVRHELVLSTEIRELNAQLETGPP